VSPGTIEIAAFINLKSPGAAIAGNWPFRNANCFVNGEYGAAGLGGQ